MAATYSIKLNDKKVVLHSSTGTLPAPSAAGDGGDISAWSARMCAVAIIADGACTLTDAYLCAYDAFDAQWNRVAQLNNGDDIVLTATLGWEDTFQDVAINSELAVEATVSANNVVVTAKPIEVTE